MCSIHNHRLFTSFTCCWKCGLFSKLSHKMWKEMWSFYSPHHPRAKMYKKCVRKESKPNWPGELIVSLPCVGIVGCRIAGLGGVIANPAENGDVCGGMRWPRPKGPRETAVGGGPSHLVAVVFLCTTHNVLQHWKNEEIYAEVTVWYVKMVRIT